MPCGQVSGVDPSFYQDPRFGGAWPKDCNIQIICSYGVAGGKCEQNALCVGKHLWVAVRNAVLFDIGFQDWLWCTSTGRYTPQSGVEVGSEDDRVVRSPIACPESGTDQFADRDGRSPTDGDFLQFRSLAKS